MSYVVGLIFLPWHYEALFSNCSRSLTRGDFVSRASAIERSEFKFGFVPRCFACNILLLSARARIM